MAQERGPGLMPLLRTSGISCSGEEGGCVPRMPDAAAEPCGISQVAGLVVHAMGSGGSGASTSVLCCCLCREDAAPTEPGCGRVEGPGYSFRRL